MSAFYKNEQEGVALDWVHRRGIDEVHVRYEPNFQKGLASSFSLSRSMKEWLYP